MATILPGKGENLIAGKVLTLGSPVYTDQTPNSPGGKVQSRTGANRGIRNLLVVCYDVDPGVQITPNTRVAPVPTRVAPEPTLVVPVPRELEEGIVLEQVVGPSFWAKFPGQRLGSTLTDANGDWELIYQDDLQKDAEPPRRIARPDLLIFVLAPEDTYGRFQDQPERTKQLKDLWVPDVVNQRVLHFSREVRLNAGRIEHYVIRIKDDLLAEAGVGDWIAQPAAGEDPTRALGDFFDRHDRLHDLLRARRGVEFNKIKAIRDRIRGEDEEGGRIRPEFMISKVFKEYGDAPYTGPAFVSAAKTSSPGEVIHSVGGVVSRAVDIVREISEDSQRRRFRFRLTDDEADKAELLGGSDTSLAVEVPVKWLMQRYRQATSGDALLANESGLTRCLKERAVDDAITRVMQAALTDASPDPESSPPAFAYDLNTQIEKLVGQMAEPAFKAEELVTERLDSTSLEQRLKGVTLQPGPADKTAYHHFHRLELALPHIWTELFDDGIRTLGEELYVRTVEAQGEHGDMEGYTATIESLEDINGLMEVAKEQTPAAGNDTGVPTEVRIMFPGITSMAWGLIPDVHAAISSKALELNIAQSDAEDPFQTEEVRQDCRDRAARLRREVDELVRAELAEAVRLTRADPLSRLLFELAERLAGPYKFTIFAPNTVNFGLFVTYRQAWRPISYQVGRLVKTIPLAPGEAREYSIKRVEKKSRNEKEVENNLSIKKSEMESKGTIEAQITSKAANKTNWKLSAEGSGSIGVFSASASAGLDGGAESASEDTKKSMREAVQKANEEDKKEHTWEVATTEETQVESTESVKISNPNQEIPVTYLLYELQRRYGIREKLHAVQPVILVANDVPPPHEVDEDFLIANDWIIRRALLDDEFVPALNYLSEGFAGDELRIDVLRQAKTTRQKTLDELRLKLQPYDMMMSGENKAVEDAVGAVMRWTREDEGDDAAAARIGEQFARERLQRVLQERADLKSLIDRTSADLAEAEKALAEALQTHANMQTEIMRLRIHVAQNIIYYMQAIWDTEHPDQRYFRLYNVKVPNIPFPPEADATRRPLTRPLHSYRDPLTRDWVCDTSLPAPLEFPVPLASEPPPESWPTLGEVADLDNMLGYKGNYMMFPLKNASDPKKGNYLTAYMAQSYVSDSGKGAGDPDPAGDATLEELIADFRCIKNERERDIAVAIAEGREAPFSPLEDDKDAIEVMRELIEQRISDPYKDEQELIVRTDSLFIEALPGSHPVLEDFKLRHRALDVQKVGAELRAQELENLRFAERLKAGEREDPKVGKRVEIKGATVLSVTEPEGPME